MKTSSNIAVVAILMATYNGEKYIADQLASIAWQTFEDWHLYVSDDGSTDGTLDLAKEFAAAHPGKVTLLPIVEPTGSACANFFRLIHDVSPLHSYYAFCDQDDVWLEDKLERTLGCMSELERDFGANVPLLSFCDACVVDAALDVVAPSFFQYTDVDPCAVQLNRLLVQNPISGAEMVINQPLLSVVKKTDNLSGVAMHDQWVGLAAAAFGRINHIDRKLYLYRQHDNNEIGAVEMSMKLVGKKKMAAKESLRKKRLQAAAFLNVYGEMLDSSSRSMFEEFADSKNRNKISRMIFLKRRKIKMNGLLRNIGLVFYF